MKLIPLNRGMFAQVDDEDYEWLSQYRWRVLVCKSTCYAARYIRKDGRDSSMRMHREILGLRHPKIKVDHKDHDGLNNRRDNIRKATTLTNNRNKQSLPGSSSRFVGVCWHKKDRRWQASITYKGKQHHLGQFDREEDAAIARDAASRKWFKKFANINLPNV